MNMISSVKPKHRMYLNDVSGLGEAMKYVVKPKHRMYLNPIRSSIFSMVSLVKPKHRMYLNMRLVATCVSL